MKLNPDCVRDIMLCIEDNLPYDSKWDISDLVKYLPEYDIDELLYTCYILHDGELLNADFANLPKSPIPYLLYINSLTFKGHEYINNIREPSIWKETKSFIKNSLGSASLAVIGELSKKLVLNQLGL